LTWTVDLNINATLDIDRQPSAWLVDGRRSLSFQKLRVYRIGVENH